MKLKYKFLLLLIAISLVGCLYVSQSYAFWMVTNEQKATNQITSGCFNINFTDTSTNSINLNNTYPVPDSLGLQETPYKFTITNACTIAANYTITLNSLSTNGIDDTKIKYALYKKVDNGKPSSGTLLSNATVNSTTSGLGVANLKKSYSIGSGSLAAGSRSGSSITNGGSDVYDLYIWIDNNAGNEVMNQTFSASVNVIVSAK